MKIRRIARSRIRRYPANPRKNAAAVQPVRASIQEFGFVQPIVLDKDLTIIIGHTRFDATEGLPEFEFLDCYVVDLPPEKCRRLRLADNSTHEFSSWDPALLAKELEAIGDAPGMQEFFADVNVAAEIAKLSAPVRAATVPEASAPVQFTPGKGKHLFPVVCPKCDECFQIDRRTIPPP
jgi:ParB-like chromosome segregation protein Spo0J